MKVTKEQTEHVLNEFKKCVGENCQEAVDTYLKTKYELPETGLVVLKNKKDFILMRTGKTSGYGFDYYGKFTNSNWSYDDFPERWRPATKKDEEHWKELLIKEAERRGFKYGVKTKKGICGETFFQNNLDSLSVCIQGSKVVGFEIISNGEWTEIIEWPKKEHFKDAEPYLIARDHFSKKLNEVYEEISKKWVHKSMLVTPYPTWKMSDEIDKNNSQQISKLDLDRSLKEIHLKIYELKLEILKLKK